MNSALDKELTDAMDQALAPMKVGRPAAVPDTRQNEGSLVDQWETMEKIRWELRQRIMDGRFALENEYRQRRHEIEHQHEKAMLQRQLDLETERDDALKRLATEIRERLSEFEALKDRLAG